jgi:hypothetical protein
MTRIFLNEREIPSPPPSLASLDEILKHVEHSYLAPNDVIRQIQVDGLPLLLDESGAVPSDLIQGIEKRETVQITTGTLQEIACDSVREAISYLDRIETAIPSLASSFQVFPGPEAFADLKELYTGFYWLNVLLDRLRESYRSLLGAPLPEEHQRLVSVLQQLVDSQEKGDFVLIADLLEYEVLPIIPVWKGVFVDIARKMEAVSTN